MQTGPVWSDPPLGGPVVAAMNLLARRWFSSAEIPRSVLDDTLGFVPE